MPRAKRDKQGKLNFMNAFRKATIAVSLTKTKKKTKESKVHLVNEIRDALNTYKTLFVFNFENLRSKKFTEVRLKF